VIPFTSMRERHESRAVGKALSTRVRFRDVFKGPPRRNPPEVSPLQTEKFIQSVKWFTDIRFMVVYRKSTLQPSLGELSSHSEKE